MKIKRFILGLISLAVFLISCSMPQGPAELSNQSDQQSGMSPYIETDAARNQGVYVNEKGLKIDIRSEEYPEGTVVNCVEAIDIAVLDHPNLSSGLDSGAAWVKAIVVGKRDDGKPGAWEILSDDTIHPLGNKEAGQKTSLLADSDDRDEGLRGRFGWVYYVTAISEDGKIAVGYAENKHSFKHPKWGIEPGTTVGVYWRLFNHGSNPFFCVSRARVIGTPVVLAVDFPNWRGHNYLGWLARRILNRLKLFFLNWLEAYLIMADSVHYDPDKEVYVVSGTDQDGREAIATIDKKGTITIEPVDGQGQVTYERIIIETFSPGGGGLVDTVLTLFDENGDPDADDPWLGSDAPPDSLAEDDDTQELIDNNHLFYSHIDYTGGLISGTYYIRVRHSSSTGTGDYCIRILSLALGDAVPALPNLTPAIPDPYESPPDDNPVLTGGVPTNLVSISIGDQFSRYLTAGDIDWFKLELP